MISSVDIARLRPAGSAEWFGERLSSVIAGADGGLAHPLAWLHHQWQQGHTCLEFGGTVMAHPRSDDDSAAEGRAIATVPEGWRDLIAANAHVSQAEPGSLDGRASLLVLEGSRLFLSTCRHDEIRVALALRALSEQPSPWAGRVTPASALASLAHLGPDIDERQFAAVCLPFQRRLSVITGGPGTGKTSVAGCILDLALSAQPTLTVAAMAPTGKAATRLTASLVRAAANPGLSEATRSLLSGMQATTIHRALRLRGGQRLGAANLILVDECSMIDLALMRAVLDAMNPQAALVMLGDPNQLASVEAGTLLADIVPSEGSHALRGCCVRLERSRRFVAGGGLDRLARAVNAGDPDETMRILRSRADDAIRWVEVGTTRDVLREGLAAYRAMSGGGCLLCGHRRGSDGSLALNRHITSTLHPRADADPLSTDDFVGRPIIITVNDPPSGLFNGDVGVVERGPAGRVARFAEPERVVPLARLPARETAHALTIHKSQGSEYGEVAVLLPIDPSPVLTRELVYTGMTRSQGRITVIGSEASIRLAVSRRIERATGLAARLAR